MSTHAENRLPCVVRQIHPGALVTEVVIEVAGGGPRIVATVPQRMVEKLGLKVGAQTYAVFDASRVLLGH